MVGTIVVVEDNPMNLKLLEQALEIAGHRICPSADGENLVAQVAGCGARLVLMDIQLPGKSGVELMRMLKADPATAAIPVLAVTAFADPDSVAEFLCQGFDRVITKPISVRGLLDAVSAYFPSRDA